MEPVTWQAVWRDTGASPIPGPASRQDASNTKKPREEEKHVHSCDVKKTLGSETILQGDVESRDRAVQQGKVARRAHMCARASGMVNTTSITHLMISDLIHPACAQTIASQLTSSLCG